MAAVGGPGLILGMAIAFLSAGCLYSECPAPDESRKYDVGVLINGETPRAGEPNFSHELASECEVLSQSPIRIVLSCPPNVETATVVEIWVDTEPPLELPFVTGETLRTKIRIESPWWTNLYFALSRIDESVVLVGASAASLSHANLFPDWRFAVLPGTCRLNAAPCVTEHHQVVELSTKEGTVQIPSGAAFDLGTMSVRAEKLARFVDSKCTDTPSAWYRFVAMLRK